MAAVAVPDDEGPNQDAHYCSTDEDGASRGAAVPRWEQSSQQYHGGLDKEPRRHVTSRSASPMNKAQSVSLGEDDGQVRRTRTRTIRKPQHRD